MPVSNRTKSELTSDVHSIYSAYFVKVYKCVIFVAPGQNKRNVNLMQQAVRNFWIGQ